jgi:arylsulfatase A-like enzyme/Flp pilus assembly protein TadD
MVSAVSRSSKLRRAVQIGSLALIGAGAGLLGWVLFHRGSESGTAVTQSVPRRQRSVLLVTVDTTRADHLQPYGAVDVETPSLARLAAQGIVFEHAYAVAPITLPAHTSIHTGLYPPQHGVRNNGLHYVPDEIDTLAERLHGVGFRTAAFVSAAVLEKRYGLDQGFEVYDDDLCGGRERHPRMVADRPAAATVSAATQWVRALKPGERFFLWVHLYDPHAAYSPPPPYRDRYRTRLYDGEIAYMDAQIGRLLAELNIERNDELVTMVIGDHGESLGEHGEQSHGIFVYDATLHVPWILSIRGMAGLRFDPSVSQIDVVPTILDLLGLPPDARLPGRSLVRLIEGAPGTGERALYAESYLPYYSYGWAKLRSLHAGRWKYIDAPRAELYDIIRDPRELANQAEQRSGTAHDVGRQLEDLLATTGEPEREMPLALDVAAAERLRQLGYLAVGSGDKPPHDQRPDPKDVVDLHVMLERARSLMDDQLFAEAEPQLRAALERDPNNLAAIVDLARAMDALGRAEEAAALLERGLTLDARYAQLYFELSELEYRRGRPERALELADAAVKNDPRSPEALVHKAELLRRLGRQDEVVPLLSGGLQNNPESPLLNAVFARLVEAPNGDLAAAETRLRATTKRDPFLVAGWQFLGAVLELSGQAEAAADAYREGLKRAPDNEDLHAALGMLLARTGADAEAESHLREALRLRRRFRSDVHVALGAWLAEHDRLPEAEAEYAKVLEVQPDEAGARNNRAIALYRMGRQAEAEAEWQALVAIHPENPDVHNNLAAAALDRRDWGEAESRARKTLALDAKLAQAWSNLGVALDEQGRLQEAENAFRQALDIDPRYWEATNNLATTLRKAGRPQDAAKLFQLALQHAPQAVEIHFELGDLYAGPLHDPDRARMHYNAILKHAANHPRAADARQRLQALEQKGMNVQDAAPVFP